MTYKNLLLSIENRVAVLTFNRPKSLNALDQETLREFSHAVETLEGNDSVHVIVLTGAGEKAFVAGGDISAMVNYTPEIARGFAKTAQDIFTKLENLPKVVIAALNGYALGGGCELAMACDLRIAAQSAKLGQPEINLGIIPGFAGTVRLPRLVGKGKAMEMMLTGDMVDAEEALSIGLVNRVVEDASLMEETMALAEKIAQKPQMAIRYCKESVQNGMEMDSLRAERYELDLFALCHATEDQKEGVRAFLEKRKPEFKHR